MDKFALFSQVSLLKFIFLVYAFFAGLVSIVLVFTGRYFRKTGKHTLRKLTGIGILALLTPVVTVLIFSYYSRFVEPNWIEVKKITLRSDKFTPTLNKLKIVQISDLHVEGIGYREKKLVAIVNRLKPDIILITGDFVTYRRDLPDCLTVLKQLKARRGIYAILGNHDYYQFHEPELVPKLRESGINIIRYGNLKLDLGQGQKIWIVGLSDHYGVLARHGQPFFLRQAFAKIPSGDVKIFLIHNPNVAALEVLREYRPDLILAGHTHGGQFGISLVRKYFWYVERSDYMAGLFKVNGMPLYVNRGIGTITKPMRFFARPEITVIKLAPGPIERAGVRAESATPTHPTALGARLPREN